MGVALAAALACGPQDGETEAPDVSEEAAAEQAPEGIDEDVAAMTEVESEGFMYKEIPVAKDSARAGEGQQVTMQGAPLVLQGKEIQVGDTLPEAQLVAAGMEPVSIRDGQGHVRIVSVVPALGTPTCEQQTHYLSERNDGLDGELELVTVSLDTTEEQTSFAADAGIENVTFLSDAPSAEFGMASGLLVETPRLLTRAVMVVDSENVVRYLQVVPEITSMPDMDAAFEFARGLLEESS